MTILEETILFILSQIHKIDKENLSKFELFKFIYLLETESYRFTGGSFFDEEVLFVREKNGPISTDIYVAIDNLASFIMVSEEKKSDYPYSRHSLSLKEGKEVSYTKLSQDRRIFVNSILLSFGKLSIKKLKEIVYNTEPMLDVQEKEEEECVECLKGDKLDFSTIILDDDMKELYEL